METIGKISVSSALAQKLGLPYERYIHVRVGSVIVNTQLLIHDMEKSLYIVSPELAEALYIKKGKTLKIRYDHYHQHIHLGPTIGILSTFVPNREEFDPTSVQADIIFLSNTGKTMPGQVYIFTPDGINWSNLTTRGYVYKQTSPDRGVWVSAVYPLPDVVYDRVSTRVSEAKNRIKSTKQKLCALPHLKYFNPYFLNKWKVHQMLNSNIRLHDYLPETRELTTDNLDDMLHKYKSVFIKPSNGSLGLGIYKASLGENKSVHYVLHLKKRFRSQADNAADFMKKTRKQRADKPYIVQQGLNLATYRGSPFDLRIIYQKDGKGEWQISKKFVRVAPVGSSISNLYSGGRAETSKRVFRYLYQRKDIIEEKNHLIKNLCHMVATTLEKTSGSIFGELGLDIGIDKNGNPYLIEVNSKPRKTTETEFSRGVMRNTFKRPLEYGVFLAGF
ncbi:YheC/YheD family endospore coat-associated protein [Syntrophomonas palmitatica]|uniref:YheC/YheD family endospore coat-associated protein n=1 Tax=Syntrophomonas palmitatica TaxID=402877 RepID=UPI0006D2227A|nr:YheC/YheD family protein [Syntrophomonas palmitatica]